jgi:hypothetical protein
VEHLLPDAELDKAILGEAASERTQAGVGRGAAAVPYRQRRKRNHAEPFSQEAPSADSGRPWLLLVLTLSALRLRLVQLSAYFWSRSYEFP